LLGEDKVRSDVGYSGFMIGGKAGYENPLTGDTVIDREHGPRSYSTAIEIEVWQIIKKK
jgi:hypothetical protein